MEVSECIFLTFNDEYSHSLGCNETPKIVKLGKPCAGGFVLAWFVGILLEQAVLLMMVYEDRQQQLWLVFSCRALFNGPLETETTSRLFFLPSLSVFTLQGSTVWSSLESPRKTNITRDTHHLGIR